MLVAKWRTSAGYPKPEAGVPCIVKPRITICGESLPDQRVNKRADMISRFFRYPFEKAANLISEFVYGVLSVMNKLPHAHAGRIQAESGESEVGIRIKDHGPVVEFLAERDVRIGDGVIS